jgi:hypothetical protein
LPPHVLSAETTAQLRAAARRAIDNGYVGGMSERVVTASPRLAWTQNVRRDEAPRVREAGERFVERDEDAPSGGGFARARSASLRSSGLMAGSRVAHRSFGMGVVVDVDESSDPTATVRFEGWGQKRVKVRFLDSE